MRVYNIHLTNNEGLKFDVNVLASSIENAVSLAQTYDGPRKPRKEYGFKPTTVFTLMDIDAHE